jgi:hypothetical protein
LRAQERILAGPKYLGHPLRRSNIEETPRLREKKDDETKCGLRSGVAGWMGAFIGAILTMFGWTGAS